MKEYIEPEMNIIEFETEDVITESGCSLDLCCEMGIEQDFD